MYFLVALLGALSLTIGFLMLLPEKTYRYNKVKKDLKHATLCVYEKEPEEKGGKFVMLGESITLDVAECSVGRKKRNSIADFRIKNSDKSFSGNAARFFFDSEHFCVQHTGVKQKIWIKKNSTGEVLLLCKAGTELGANIKIGFGATDFVLLSQNFCQLESGDRILLGKTMLEYLEGDERIYGN